MFEKLKERIIKLLFGILKMEMIVVSISIIGMGTLEAVYLFLYCILDSLLGVVISSSNFKFISNIFLLIYMISRFVIYRRGRNIILLF